MTNSSHRKIVIPGGSGQVGTLVARHFHSTGHEVVVLSRRPRPAPWRVVSWDGKSLGDWTREIDRCDVVINLAGRSVNCRYTAENRREIMDSRVLSTCIVGAAIHASARPPRVWMNASAATIYRHALDRPMDEATGEIGGQEPGAPSTWRFSIEVARAWEAAFHSIATPRTRKIVLRSAIVMSPGRGGPFDTLLWLVRFGLGGRNGSGKQFVSWIHYQDFLRSLDFLLQSALVGVVNIASPNPLPNAGFMAALRAAWGARIGLPSSRWMLELGAVFLRTETELILKSRRVIPGRLLDCGFRFQFPDWPTAAQALVAQSRQAL